MNCEKQGQWMDLEIITLSKLTVTKKKKEILHVFSHMQMALKSMSMYVFKFEY